MVATTFLLDSELDIPTGDEELDELLADACRLTGRNYQILIHTTIERYGFLGLKKRRVNWPQLYLEVGGMAPWQVMQCAGAYPTVKAYLYGLVNGASSH
jgi:hypothetical protein